MNADITLDEVDGQYILPSNISSLISFSTSKRKSVLRKSVSFTPRKKTLSNTRMSSSPLDNSSINNDSSDDSLVEVVLNDDFSSNDESSETMNFVPFREQTPNLKGKNKSIVSCPKCCKRLNYCRKTTNCIVCSRKYHSKCLNDDKCEDCIPSATLSSPSISTPRVAPSNSSPSVPAPSVVSQGITIPAQGRKLLQLDTGEQLLDIRLQELGLRRCLGQLRTPRDGNCGPHAIVHQLATNSQYGQTNVWKNKDHHQFRQMTTLMFSVQVQQGTNWYFDGDINR